MFARLVAARPTVSLASTAAATSTSTTTHATQHHVRAFSFFSSKSGGGGDGSGNKYKYFTANSSSSRRSSPPNGANENGGNGGAASSKPKMDGHTTTTATATAATVGAASATETANPTSNTTAKSQPPEDVKKKGDSPPTATVSPPPSPSTSNPATSDPPWTTNWQPQPVHAPLTANDLNLHSFFSVHRPLLLLSQPSSSIFESWSDLQLPNPPDSDASRHRSLLNQLGGINLEDPPEATPEEDAVAARLLNRALVVNRLGGAVSWEETLAKLGDVEERMSLAEMGMGAHAVVDVSMSGFDAYMDSTKRKRRKKMKTHKLKKRRRVCFFFRFLYII